MSSPPKKDADEAATNPCLPALQALIATYGWEAVMAAANDACAAHVAAGDTPAIALASTGVSGTPSASGASPSLPGSSTLVPAGTSPELPSASEAVAAPQPNLLAVEAGLDSDDEDCVVSTLAGNKRVKPNPPKDA